MPIIPKQTPPYYEQSTTSGTPTKQYIAIITQTGTAAPVATILKNTYNETPIWTRESSGIYRITTTAELTENKTTILTSSINGFIEITYEDPQGNYIDIKTSDNTLSPGDDWLYQNTIIITTYP